MDCGDTFFKKNLFLTAMQKLIGFEASKTVCRVKRDPLACCCSEIML